MDDCARAGGRVAHSVDDSAARSVGLLDEAGHARAGALGEAGHARAGALGEVASGSRGVAAESESHWASHAVDLGFDVELEVLQNVGGGTTTMDTASEVKCPRVVAISRDVGAWTELMSGFGIACAPIVVVGALDDAGTRVTLGGEPTKITSIVDTCLTTGARCMVAGCAGASIEACEQAVNDGLLATPLTPSLVDYERALAVELLTRKDGPLLVAQHVRRAGKAHVAIGRRATK